MSEDATSAAADVDLRVVFLSHSSQDTAEVESLRAALEARGITCFLDVLELRAGDELVAVVHDELRRRAAARA